MAVSEVLQLDVRQALSNIEQLDRRMTQATSSFKTGLATATQQLKVGVDSKGLDEASAKTKALTTDVGALGAQAQSVGKKWTDSLKQMAIAAIGVTVAVQVFRDMIAEALEAEKVTAQVNQVIKSTGGIAGVSAAHVDNLANTLSELNGVDDELIARGAAVLLTFTNVRNEMGKGNDVFDRAVTLAGDMSAALGTDLQGSIIQVGKALQDPITGFTALRRVGVALSDQQKESIKTFVEQGDILSAQKVILDELQKEFGGTAAAIATDSEKAAVQFKNFQEAAGKQLLPFVNGLLEAGVAVLDLIDQLGGLVAVAPAVAGAILIIATAVQTGFPYLAAFGFAVTALVAAISLFQSHSQSMSQDIDQLAERISKLDARAAAASFNKYANELLRANAEAERMGAGIEGAGSRLEIFNKVAEQSPAVAQKIIEGMAAAGKNTDKYTEALNRSVLNQKLGAEETEKLRQANIALSGSYEEQLDLLNELNDELAAQYDKQFAAAHANEQARDAIAAQNTAYDDAIKAGKSVAEAEEARARATTNAEEASLKSAQAAGALAIANYQGEDAAEAARLGTEAQKAELDKLIGTLDPNKDAGLIAFLVNYRNQLNDPALNSTHTAGVEVKDNTVGGSAAFLAAIKKGAEDLDVALKNLGGVRLNIGSGGFAGGGQVTPAAGGAFGRGTFLVGEQGVELFRPTTPGVIVPHPATMGLLGSAGSPITVMVNVTGTVDPRTARRVGEEVGAGFVDAVTRRRLSVAARAG